MRSADDEAEDLVTKDKQEDGRESNDAFRSALASLEDAHAQARAVFDQAFERLERDASSRLQQIADRSAEDANAVTAAMLEVLALTEARSSEAVSEMKARRRDLRDRQAAVFEETEGLRVAVEEARTAADAAVHEVEARGQEQLREMVAWRDQELGCLLADATDRVERALVALGGAVGGCRW